MSLRDASDPSKTLRQIDGRGYKAYKQLTGAYGFDTWLFIDHVQGNYFEPADTVITMMDYLPEDATAEAKAIAARQPTGRTVESESPLKLGHSRRFGAARRLAMHPEAVATSVSRPEDALKWFLERRPWSNSWTSAKPAP